MNEMVFSLLVGIYILTGVWFLRVSIGSRGSDLAKVKNRRKVND